MQFSPPDSQIISDEQRFDHLSMSIRVIYTSHNASRQYEYWKSWGEDFYNLAPHSTVANYYDHPLPNLPCIVTNVSMNVVNVERPIPLYLDALKDFLANSNYAWLLRTSEDCFVDITRLQNYIDSLNALYNPYVELLTIGHAVPMGGRYFLHGGSGWLISRAAARYFISTYDDLTAPIFQTSYGDDVLTFNFSHFLGVDDSEVNSYAFLGPTLDNQSTQILVDYLNARAPQKCKDSQYKPFPMKDVIFWHSGRADLEALIHGYEILSHIPPHVFVEYANAGMKLCWKL